MSYEIQTSDGAIDVYARAHSAVFDEKIRKAATRHNDATELGAGISVLPDSAIAVYVYPNDHELRSLKRLVNPDRRRRMIKRTIPDYPALWRSDLQRLRYKPERRYVGRLTAPHGESATIRFYDRHDFDVAVHNAQAFESSGLIRFPKLLGVSQRHSLVVLEWMKGVPIVGVQAPLSSAEARVRTVGEALATLHAQTPQLAGQVGPDEYLHTVEESAETIGTLCPDLHDEVTELCAAIAPSLRRTPWRMGAVHGDFSADQVLLDDNRVCILDLDRAAVGDPRLDLGMFAACLMRDAALGAHGGTDAATLAAALLDGYARATGDEVENVDAFIAASLLRIAPEPFRYRSPDWAEGIHKVVAQAREVLP